MSFFTIVFLTAILIVSLTGLTHIFLARFRRIRTPIIPAEQLPFISVIIPARNEETKIARCLESLAKQDYPNYEIVIIDDRSTDKTSEIIQEIAARYPHIKFIKGHETPTGWIGKCNALVQAYPHARGDWMVFSDADTCHEPHSLRYAVDYAIINKVDMISFMPLQELRTFWEQVVSPVMLGSFLAGDPLNSVNDPNHVRAYAYGQFILISRNAYETVGTHRAVHDQILDDIMLAQRVKGNGFHIMAVDGCHLYKVRMYQDFESLWFGWTKNAYALIECNLLYLAMILILINGAIISPFVHLAILAQGVATGNVPHIFMYIVPLVAVEFIGMAAWYGHTKQFYDGAKWRHFFLLPLGCVIFTAIYLRSAYLVLSGNKVSWKGRQYRVNSHKTIEPQPGETGEELPVESVSIFESSARELASK